MMLPPFVSSTVARIIAGTSAIGFPEEVEKFLVLALLTARLPERA